MPYSYYSKNTLYAFIKIQIVDVTVKLYDYMLAAATAFYSYFILAMEEDELLFNSSSGAICVCVHLIFVPR